MPILRSSESEYVNDAYAKSLTEAFEDLRGRFEDLGVIAESIASSFVAQGERVNRERFYSSVENTLGVDLSKILKSEDLEDVLLSVTRENVALIKSIPGDYFDEIESMVFRGTTQGRNANSMTEDLMKKGDVSEKRAKLIARDQSSKLNSALNRQRQKNLGVEEYIWRTAGDGRVRHDHAENNGKVFRWDSPPANTGHPGTDVQCRCVAQPIMKI